MLSRLVEIIEGKAEYLGKLWTKKVLEHPLTPSYQRLSEEEKMYMQRWVTGWITGFPKTKLSSVIGIWGGGAAKKAFNCWS